MYMYIFENYILFKRVCCVNINTQIIDVISDY